MSTVPRRRRRRRNRPGLVGDVRQAMREETGAALVPAAFFAFAILDLVPVPTDIIFFRAQKWLRDNRDRISPRRYWLGQWGAYFLPDAGWYSFLGAITYFGAKTLRGRAFIALSLISGGAIVTMLWRYAKSEEEQRQLAQAP